MPGIVGNGVTLRGLRSEDFTYTWNISGTAGVSPPIGCPMMIDATANETAKQVTDNAVLLGELRSYENRVQEGLVLGAIAHKGNFTWPYTGTAPTRGNSVVGSAVANTVKAAVATPGCVVVEVDTVNSLVTVMFG